jgi:hypothetical protein
VNQILVREAVNQHFGIFRRMGVLIGTRRNP